MTEIVVTQGDKAKRAEILKYLIESIERPCTPGDGPDERNDELERMIAAHRLATIEECAKVAESDDLILSDSRSRASFGRARKDHGDLIATAIRKLGNNHG